MTNARRSARWTLGCVTAATCSLAFASPSLGASVTLIDPSPANGATVQSTNAGVKIPVAWTAEATGCRPGSLVTVRVNKTSSEPTEGLIGDPIVFSGVPGDFSGTAGFSRSINPRTSFVNTWSVSLSCPNAVVGQPLIEVSSEARALTVLAPDPRPRAVGVYNVFFGGKIKNAGRPRSTLSGSGVWTVRPLCRVGPCRARVNIRKVGNIALRYNAKKKLWTAAITGPKLGKIFTCRSARNFRGIKGAVVGRLNVKLRVKKGSTRVVGAQTRGTQLVGTLVGTLTPNAKGKRQRCPSAKVNGTIKAFAR